MDYELAKQLKDAGFPVKETLYYDEVQIIPDNANGKVILRNLIVPTLEELIEACGNDFHYLTYDITWRAFAKGDKDGQRGHYKSPTEAVAKLWLSLSPNLAPNHP